MTTERNGVLAVMDEMIDCYGSVEECPDDTEFLVAARGARAAVADLIEAAEILGDLWDASSMPNTLARKNLRTALARVGAP